MVFLVQNIFSINSNTIYDHNVLLGRTYLSVEVSYFMGIKYKTNKCNSTLMLHQFYIIICVFYITSGDIKGQYALNVLQVELIIMLMGGGV